MEDYGALPMLLSQEDIARAVAAILAEARSDPPPPPLVVAEALVGMVSRQSSHMKPFAPETAASIERWAADNWSSVDPGLADALATLLVNTDSGLGLRVLTDACAAPLQAVQRIAEDALRELS
jgi:hypothetical protein